VAQGSKCHRLLSELPVRISTELFAAAKLVRLPAGRVLFRAGDSSHGCYRVEDGLLKVTIISGSGATFWRSWGRGPSSVSFLSLTGCHVRRR
jgi:hypothetical protein